MYSSYHYRKQKLYRKCSNYRYPLPEDIEAIVIRLFQLVLRKHSWNVEFHVDLGLGFENYSLIIDNMILNSSGQECTSTSPLEVL